jgi:hypothetical protein
MAGNWNGRQREPGEPTLKAKGARSSPPGDAQSAFSEGFLGFRPGFEERSADAA